MSCPDCIRIRHELDAAVERVRQLEQAVGGDMAVVFSKRLRLAPMPGKLIAMLMELEVVTTARAHLYLYGNDPNGGPETKIIGVMICNLRRKLRRHGIDIETHWGAGWSLSPDMKAKVRELIGGGS